MRILLLSTLLGLAYALPAQIQNDQISYIWRVNEASALFVGEDGVNEYTMTFGRSTTPFVTDYPLCLAFDGENGGVFEAQVITNNFGINQPYDDPFYINLSAWEDDGGERCVYDEGDDQLYAGFQLIPGESIPGNGGPSRWLTNTGDQGAECAGSSLLPITTVWNFCYSVIWRHDAGDNAGDPLIFNSNFFTGAKSHFNSNRTGEITGGSSYYTNQFGEASADVYYSFQLSEDYADVSISTDFPETNFDTKIYLIQNGEVIDQNDDIIPGANLKSRIQRSLCAGFYQVVVEGYSQSEGDFKLEIDATGFVGPLETFRDLAPATCEGAADGILLVDVQGGVPPYSFQLVPGDGSGIIDFDGYYGELTGGLSYYYRVTDFCGNVLDSDNFVTDVMDTVAPNPICYLATISLTDDVVDLPFSEGAIMQLAELSYDNCGAIVDAFIFPAVVSASDAPVFSYELTVYDEAGNSATELCELNIDIVTGLEQSEELKAAVHVFPNPVVDLVQVSWSDLPIRSGELWLRDQLGRPVAHRRLENTPSDHQLTFDLSDQPAGIYTLQLVADEGHLTRRIVVE